MVPDNGQLPVSDAVISPGSFAWRLPQISSGCSTIIHPGDRRRIAPRSFIGTACIGPQLQAMRGVTRASLACRMCDDAWLFYTVMIMICVFDVISSS